MIFSDAVYGVIELPDFLVRCVVDTTTFQRLRRIKQIGLGHLVYPSHDGTRFQHSLGVAHLASKALDNLAETTKRYVLPSLSSLEAKEVEEVLKLSKSLKTWFQFFMLLHDVGHGPLSHNYEDAVYEASSIWGVKVPKASPKKLHEYVSKKIAYKYLQTKCGNKTVAERLCEEAGEAASGPCSEDPLLAVVSLLEPQEGIWDSEAFQGVRAIFSFLSNGEIDVDRGDYLMRDAILAGTRIGLFDYERLYNVLAVVPAQRGMPVEVAVVDKGVSTVESMLLSRFYMYENVYLHKTILMYSSIASRLMAWWIKENKMPKMWEIEDIDWVDDCLFYKLLYEEKELKNLVKAARERKHSHLVRVEVVNKTVEGEIRGLLYPPYEMRAGRERLADLVREQPELLAYGARIKPFGQSDMNVFVRRTGEVLPLINISPIISNLVKVQHIKFYLAGPKELEDEINELVKEIRDSIAW